jgi:UDP-N-acetylmuramyl pentapeptide phosphotransferase/UDP-N-acetylglucosamine-1-phosphate transferase
MVSDEINKKCWRKLTYGMIGLAIFAAASHYCMIIEDNNPGISMFQGPLEYAVGIEVVFMGLALSFISFIDLYKLVRQDLTLSQDKERI